MFKSNSSVGETFRLETEVASSHAEESENTQPAKAIAYQEELDWRFYRAFGLISTQDKLEWPEKRIDELPRLALGQRAFEIVLARKVVSGELETLWFERHKDVGSKPITELPAHWPDDYRTLVERRLAFIESDKNINLIERPEYKRRWNTEPWAKRQKEALLKWLLTRLEGYFFEGDRVCEITDGFDPAAEGFRARSRPQLVTVNALADTVAKDARFLEAAALHEGSEAFDIPMFLRKLVESESVPFLPVHRYKPTGLRRRAEWEKTWEQQRLEDAVEERVVKSEEGNVGEEALKEKVRAAQVEEVGDIPVPPKYAGKDFKKPAMWKLRGKLDVPKERWVSYPGCERDGDTSPVIAWAGWDHLQQAQALAEYYLDAKDKQGWVPSRLAPLLAGLSDLLPWLHQWHNDPDPAYGMGLGTYFSNFLEEQCRTLDLTVDEVEKLRFEEAVMEDE